MPLDRGETNGIVALVRTEADAVAWGRLLERVEGSPMNPSTTGTRVNTPIRSDIGAQNVTVRHELNGGPHHGKVTYVAPTATRVKVGNSYYRRSGEASFAYVDAG